ncbi:aminotransferase [Nocardioides sp. GY 10113]|uniref:aminotransferase n=1 Tax=Nocardioides sp. GY 10113 TaxID=2569761 RepID=UPI0010A93587|nr:aminotransferase [Nocardioides sp. GY 10113]TIC81293.1 aminotransferase [Nocardioides sp. GY 10113]
MDQDWELRSPEVSREQASAIAAGVFGVGGELSPLGSQQDRNFRLVDGEGGSWLLKISNPVFTADEIDAQNAVMQRLAGRGVGVPEPVPALDGALRSTVDIDGVPHPVRLLTWVAGRPLIDHPGLDDELLAAVGALAGDVSVALAGFAHPGLDRELQWDLRRAASVVGTLIDHVTDAGERERLRDAVAAAAAVVDALAPRLPEQAVHGDLTDDNLLVDDAGHLAGIIDFGDVSTGWRIAELVVACSFVLHHEPSRPLAVLPLIAAFDAHARLSDDEIEAIWPLLVLRGATLVVSGRHQVAIDPGNDYARAALGREWAMFEAAADADREVMTGAIRAAIRGEGAPEGWRDARPLLVDGGRSVVEVPLGYDSRALLDGAWLGDADAVEAALALQVAGDAVAVTRFAEPRLTRAGGPSASEPCNVPLFVQVSSADPIDVVAPVAGEVAVDGSTVVLRSGGLALVLDGPLRAPAATGEVRAGDPVATFDGPIRVWHVRADRAAAPGRPTAFVRPSEVAGWRTLYLDPAPLLRHPGERPTSETGASVLGRRTAAYAPLQGHYYARPPQIERGWREYLIDTDGRHYLDMVNNVAAVGHGHPRLAAAVADQWRMLNTNSRFHYRSVVELSERLIATVPAPLETVLLVNSGSEAVDLALRLALAHTGRTHVACVGESYHGWTLASDAVSTSTSDNPLAEETRPDWVRVLDTPNAYRGTHRGPGAGALYTRDAVARIRRWAADGDRLAAFIAEPRNGNAGAIEVPEGYLAAVYDEVRAQGGLCIADEVQVGYGRQGDVFWGYQQHPGVVPDILTAAKAMGNGHPLGAVITRADIAQSLAEQGAFFSSAGGSTLSARLGTTVLDIIRDEGLQEHARAMGERLVAGFAELAQRHPLIGAVHGRGLYLGLELVRDRETLEPAAAETRELCDRMLRRGVIIQPTGDRQNVLKVKPPMCISAESVDYFLAALDAVLGEGL